MRERSAPEVRGTRRQTRCRPADNIGLPLLLLCVYLAVSSFTPSTESARAGSADTTIRQLQRVSGEAKPTFALPDLEGVNYALEQHAGRTVLVHFFATWCEPCREELSSLTRLVDRPGGAPVSVVAVNVAEVPTRVRRFLDAAPVNFPVLLDSDRAVTKAWGRPRYLHLQDHLERADLVMTDGVRPLPRNLGRTGKGSDPLASRL